MAVVWVLNNRLCSRRDTEIEFRRWYNKFEGWLHNWDEAEKWKAKTALPYMPGTNAVTMWVQGLRHLVPLGWKRCPHNCHGPGAASVPKAASIQWLLTAEGQQLSQAVWRVLILHFDDITAKMLSREEGMRKQEDKMENQASSPSLLKYL